MTEQINRVIGIVFMVCYSYQFFYLFMALIKKPLRYPEASPKRYAVMIAARNEEAVIGNLIDSIKHQNYPAELIDVFVVADNCTDGTYGAAKAAGACVFKRKNKDYIGKGYALEFLFNKVMDLYPGKYDGYFIFDADNLLDPNYVYEMNKCMSAGYKVATSYRNSKNYGSNWISAGYALWFLREAKYLNNPRSILGTSCAVSGTGFLISREIVEKNNGWQYFLLTEDIEFTVDSVTDGIKIGYCESARLYDEQPESFMQSWTQRMRWARGYLQVFMKYGGRLLRGMFTENFMSCFDMTMNIMPAAILSIISIILNVVSLITAALSGLTVGGILLSVLKLLAGTYTMLFVLGTVTGITEWRHIHCSSGQKILSFFTFPIFMLTYIPISAAALVCRVTWKPIKHTCAVSIKDMDANAV